MRLGAHVSIKGGIENSPYYGKLATCEVIQIFSKNQLQWNSKDIDLSTSLNFKNKCKEYNIEPLSIHASYLINLASPNKDLQEQSITDLAKELEKADELGIRYVVVHPGAHMGEGDINGIKRVGNAIKEVFKRSNSKRSILLLETTAGEGSVLGYRFEQLRDMLDLTNNTSRMGVCFDTCHVFAAGYDIRTEDSFENVLYDFNKKIGLKYLNLFHLNDSKRDLGERLDRHEEIGLGKIGINAFKFLVNYNLFSSLGGILEIPGDIDGYKRNLSILRRLIDGENL
ncbi:MAG: deoxyribonuclease IV [Caldisericaceae bacterium]